MDSLIKPIVLVTGFGPFENHPVNASWEAVKLINKEEIEDKHKIELVLLEIPVTYENVDEFVPALWDTHEPKLMIHVGVSSIAKCLTLETQAHKKGYQRMDYFDQCPANHICPADGAIRIHTKLNVERICDGLNADGDKARAVSSKDAGSRTLFVHVPDASIASSKDVAAGLERIINECLKQIDEGNLEAGNKVTLENDDDNHITS